MNRRFIDPTIPPAHAVTDLAGTFLNVDAMFLELTRRDLQTVLGRSILELTAEPDRSLNGDKLNTLRESGRPFVIRKTYPCGDGGTQLVENAVSLLTDGAGGLVLAATVQPLSDANNARYVAMVRAGRLLLKEQRARTALQPPLRDHDWTLLLAAYLLEAEGAPAYAGDICEVVGGDQHANLQRLWELVGKRALVVDGESRSLEHASVLVSQSYVRLIERHLAVTLEND